MQLVCKHQRRDFIPSLCDLIASPLKHGFVLCNMASGYESTVIFHINKALKI